MFFIEWRIKQMRCRQYEVSSIVRKKNATPHDVGRHVGVKQDRYGYARLESFHGVNRVLALRRLVARHKLSRQSSEPAHAAADPLDRILPKTREDRDKWDAQMAPIAGVTYLRRVLEEGRHWEKIRFQANKTPRARKRALEREARRERHSRPGG